MERLTDLDTGVVRLGASVMGLRSSCRRSSFSPSRDAPFSSVHRTKPPWLVHTTVGKASSGGGGIGGAEHEAVTRGPCLLAKYPCGLARLVPFCTIEHESEGIGRAGPLMRGIRGLPRSSNSHVWVYPQLRGDSQQEIKQK
jgi:hypothetical protein